MGSLFCGFRIVIRISLSLLLIMFSMQWVHAESNRSSAICYVLSGDSAANLCHFYSLCCSSRAAASANSTTNTATTVSSGLPGTLIPEAHSILSSDVTELHQCDIADHSVESHLFAVGDAFNTASGLSLIHI